MQSITPAPHLTLWWQLTLLSAHVLDSINWIQSLNQLNDKIIVSDLIQNLDMIIVIVNNFSIVCDYYL